MGLLNRKKLLEKEKVEVVKVDLNDEDFIYVCQMTGHARDAFERSLFTYIDQPDGNVKMQRKLGNFRAKLAVNTICDENARLLLRPNDFDEFSQSVTSVTLEKIIEAAQKLNAISEEDKEKLVKNLDGGQAAGSNSGSVESSE